MAKVLIVNGTARKNGNTRILAEKVAAGAAENGHQVETVDIGGMDIRACSGCEACLSAGVGKCVIADDMRGLYAKIIGAEVLILSSPIYWFNLCGQIKNFIDRCFAVAANRDSMGKSPFAGKKIGAILVYGDTDPFNSGCVNALRCLQDICSYTSATWASAIYGSAYGTGEVAGNEELLARAHEYGTGL